MSIGDKFKAVGNAAQTVTSAVNGAILGAGASSAALIGGGGAELLTSSMPLVACAGGLAAVVNVGFKKSINAHSAETAAEFRTRGAKKAMEPELSQQPAPPTRAQTRVTDIPPSEYTQAARTLRDTASAPDIGASRVAPPPANAQQSQAGPNNDQSRSR
ncbi:MAG: hypothetical protein MK052_09860 [Alphaproteobacteria bacterium]|nr:hypothetical protein [Alphaproteobacteria bacterium]